MGIILAFLFLCSIICLYGILVETEVPTVSAEEIERKRNEALLLAELFEDLSGQKQVDTTWSDMYIASVLSK